MSKTSARRSVSAQTDATDARRADLAAIHMAKAKLGWSREEYEDVMSTVCAGVRSSAALDFTGRKRFLAHLQACQRASGLAPVKTAAKGTRKPFTPMQRKIWSLWQQLADADLVRDRTGTALDSQTFRTTGVNKMVWLNDQQQLLMIESLKKWLDRRQEPT